jgi:hypothetical protein
MDHYSLEELDEIERAPKRRDLIALVAEVKRLTAIAHDAEQLLNVSSPSTRPMLEMGLRQTIEHTKRSQWPIYTKPAS